MPPKSKRKTSNLNPLKLEPVQPKKPLSFFSVSKPPPAFDIKGKGKAVERITLSSLNQGTLHVSENLKRSRSRKYDIRDNTQIRRHVDDRLWVDKYEPTSESELAVHKKKVEVVRQWLMEAFDGGPNGKLVKYRRILVLTGPAGAAKTATIRVLSRELGFGIQEWRNAVDESNFGLEVHERESLTQKFQGFLARASSCRPLVSTASTSSSLPKQVILLEDLPNILHAPTQEAFHSVITSFVTSPSSEGIPLILIVSDAGTRGEDRDEDIAQRGWSGVRREVADVRAAIPPALLSSPYLMQISFNPIAPTLLKRALQALLARHVAENSVSSAGTRSLTKEDIDIIVESADGDIRSAIMSLEFAYGATSRAQCLDSERKGDLMIQKSSRKTKPNREGTRRLLEAVTRREHSLALFHLLGKVLYNKRKGDPPSSHLSLKDLARERDLDAKVATPPPLPSWMEEHSRRGSRIDVDMLYADSPIDTGLFSLYLHQNYTQFCQTVEECESISDWYSWVDSSGGDRWHQANPHQFHLVTLGTLHSLPSPVPRLGQKMYKPEYFATLQATREAEDALSDTRQWLLSMAAGSEESAEDRRDFGNITQGMGGLIANAWSGREVVTELPLMLKLLGGKSGSEYAPPPRNHSAFSAMTFRYGATGTSAPLTEDNVDGAAGQDDAYGDLGDVAGAQALAPVVSEESRWKTVEVAVDGGRWLDTDDIEDF